MESILHWDRKLFLAINQAGNETWDPLARLIASPEAWLLMVGLACAFMIVRQKWSWLPVLLLVLVGVGISDAVTGHLLKGYFQRARPCVDLPGVRVVADACVNRPSFPSNHATNGMTAAVILFLSVRKRWAWGFIVVAFAGGLTRVYQGLHYPTDILAGFFVGSLIGMSVYAYLRPLAERAFRPFRGPKPNHASRM